MSMQHCRIVLVRPHYPGNVGATARVMRNFGLEDLVLVAPVADINDRRAREMSTQGEDILDKARIVPDLGDAVGDCTLVVATSARTGGLFRRQSSGSPREILPKLAELLAPDRPAALVFGPEPNGLGNDEISRCHYLVHIPSSPEYPALNLAQAVAICLYELYLSCDEPVTAVDKELTPATFAAQEHMFAQLRTALEEIHFLYGDKADALMHGLRHLLGKASLSQMEVQLLLGLARQMRWFAAAKPPGERGASAP
jgi:tRNA/rRNA methyltransferase